MATVRFRGTHADVVRIALQLAAIISGRATDTQGVARSFLLTLGFGALSDIKDAYVTKAKGGVDEMGVKWPPLSPAAIANRRVGPGDKKTQSTQVATVQQAALVRERERIRKRETNKALKRLRMSLAEPEAQRRSKIIGGLKATSLTGKTKAQTLGGRDVEILRDTGVLLNSLGPGRLTGRAGSVAYTKPQTEGGEEQIFDTAPGQIIVGTNVAYASTHQNGDEGRNIPARPFLPNSATGVPQVWWDRWTAIANKALVASAELMFRRMA